MILLGAFAGLRLGGAVSLQWESVDRANGTITTIPEKTKRMRRVLTIPMHPELRSFLAKRMPKGKATGAIFPTLARMAIKGRNSLSRQFKAIMKSAGVEQNLTAARKAAADSNLGTKRRHMLPERSFHSLRHTITS